MIRRGHELPGLFTLAVVLRLGWVFYRWSQTGAALEYPDEELHWQLGVHLVQDGSLVTDDGRYAARMPLYPLFLALFVGAGALGVLAARVAQALLGGLTVLVAYRWASAAIGPRAALVAGALVGCDPFAVFFSNLLLTETLFGLVLVALMTSVWHALTRPARGIPAAALLGAAAVLLRPSAAGLLPLLWGVMAIAAGDRRSLMSRLWLCPLVLLAALLPWGLRNRAVIGTFAWLSTNGGVTLYDAQGPQADGSSNQAFLDVIPELVGLDEPTRDRVLQRLAVEQMKREPARVLRLAGRKFVRTWSPLPNVAAYRAGPAAWAGAAFTIALLTGAFAGLVSTLRPSPRAGPRPWRLLVTTWLPVVYFALLHCIYVGSVRYRLPLTPLLAVAAGTCRAWRDTARVGPSADESSPPR